MKRRALCLSTLLLLSMFFAWPISAQEITIWHSPRTIIDPHEQLSIGPAGSSSAVRLLSPSGPGTRLVHIPLFLPSNVIVKSIELCYDLSNSATYIEQFVLIEMTTPGVGSTRLSETMDLTSVTPVCHTTTTATIPPNYSPSGSMYLLLELVFSSTTDSIDLGAIGIHVEPVP
jgi:hypothetical protein